MDFVQTLDPSKLVLGGTGLSFLLALGISPSYNFPLYLFGCYAQEAAETSQSLQTFTGLLGVSAIFDIIWLIKNDDQHGFFKFLTVVLLLLKLPTFFAFAMAVRQRGGQFGLGANTLGGGPTVWSMPGGFTSNGGREGYQTVDDDAFIRNTRATPAAYQKPAAPLPAEPAAPGAYQGV